MNRIYLLVMCLLAVGFIGQGLAEDRTAPKPVARLVTPEAGAYTGAYVDFGDFEDTVTLEALEGFEKMVEKKQAIIGFSNFWGRQKFPTEALGIIQKYGATSLIYWNPWDGSEKSNPNRFALQSILDGTWDTYLTEWGNAAREFGHPVMVSWGLEMNGNWFPWSGLFAGAGEIIPWHEVGGIASCSGVSPSGAGEECSLPAGMPVLSPA
jgi:hypothetical protein